MATPNPFRPTRFEHHDHPLIWLAPNVKLLESLKSVYVAGTRGSGKTSLLKAINWRERQFNPTVHDQVVDEVTEYVGVYFRLPDYLTGAIGLVDWKLSFPQSPAPEIVGYEIFSQLVEFVAAQLVCEAVSSLRSAQRFTFLPADEDTLVSAILARYAPLAKAASPSGCQGLDGLSQIFRQLHQRLNVLITRGQVQDTSDYLLEVQPGVFIHELASSIVKLARGEGATDFHIKVCLDDCETLRPLQQKYLNSLVRSTKSPVFWVVSYVSTDYDSTNTIYYSQTLSDGDRVQLILDDMRKTEFFDLCEGVSLLRIYYSDDQLRRTPLKELPTGFFSLEGLLGKFSTNELLFELSQHSLSEEFANLVIRSQARRRGKRPKGPPPIFETYVLEKLGDRLVDDRPPNLQAYLRRKNVAALLAICAEFRVTNIPYAGASTIVALSNGSIRDYLEIMASIFDEAGGRGELAELSNLTVREIPLSTDVQRIGVKKSSRIKFDGIRNIMERDWVEANRTIEFVGKLTALLQANPNVESTLATPERGNFIFDLSEIGSDGNLDNLALRRDIVARVLRRCAADGLLRPAREDQTSDTDLGEVAFHIHRRFAAEFGFSYRGPYGILRMPMEEFAEACVGSSTKSVELLALRAYQRILKENLDEQPRLI